MYVSMGIYICTSSVILPISTFSFNLTVHSVQECLYAFFPRWNDVLKVFCWLGLVCYLYFVSDFFQSN